MQSPALFICDLFFNSSIGFSSSIGISMERDWTLACVFLAMITVTGIFGLSTGMFQNSRFWPKPPDEQVMTYEAPAQPRLVVPVKAPKNSCEGGQIKGGFCVLDKG